MSYWANTVPRVKDGETTFSADSLNPIIDALSNRTEYLYNLSGDRGYIMPDIGFSDECKKGVLVARDPSSEGRYVPASAVWGGTGADGSFTPSYKANVIGVLINNPADNGGIGSILCEGWTSDTELINALAPDRIAGDYYLTSAEDTQGKATCTDVSKLPLRAYCYTYISTGKLYINPGKPDYAGHAHSSVVLPNSWKAVENIGTIDAEIPSNAAYVMDVTDNDWLRDLITANPQKPCLVRNGVETSPDTWGIADTIIYLTFTPEPTDVFTLHAITPLTANESLVRQVKTTSDNKLIYVNNVGGKVWLGINKAVDESHYSGVGVTALDSQGLKLGPVVQGIKAGAGAEIIRSRDAAGRELPGVFEVAVSQYKNTLIDMNLCNLNNVVIGTSLDSTYYIFPVNSESSLIGTIRIPHFSNLYQRGELVFVFKGNAATISGLQARVLIQPTPEVGGSCSIPTSVTYDVPVITGASRGMCYCQSVTLGGDKQQLYSDGLLICELMSTGSTDITMMSMSFRLL